MTSSILKGVYRMAKNTGNGSRVSSFNNRAQVLNKTGRFIKQDSETDQFIDQKSDNKLFKGVAREPDKRHSKVNTHPFFGMNQDEQETVEAVMNQLRGSRY